jgi:DNA-binding transcriptional LysR family regulator
MALSDLADEDFVFFPDAQGPVLHARVMAAFRQTGFLPRVTQEARQMHTILSLVAAGMGVSLVPEGGPQHAGRRRHVPADPKGCRTISPGISPWPGNRKEHGARSFP